MLDAAHSNQPEGRSLLIARELCRLNVDIAAISEVCFPRVGSLQEHGAGYTLVWSRKPSTEGRLSGVGFIVSTFIASRLGNLLTGHCDRIMSMRFPLKNKRYVMLFSMYVPTLRAEPAEKDKFYSELRSTSVDDKVIILSDFNAKVGQDAESCKGVLGRHGVGNCNGNGRLLLELCTEQQVVLTNTVFQQKDRLKTNWMPPRFKHWHQIDYVLVHKGDLKDFIHTKAMPSAECHTDHCLVRCKLKLQFKPKPKKREISARKSSIWTNFSQLKWKLTFKQAYSPSLKTVTAQKTLLKHAGINWRVPFCRHLKKFLGLPLRSTKTGSTRTTKKFRNWLSRYVLWGVLPSVSFAVSSITSFVRSKMSGWPITQRELSNNQT